MQVERLVVDNTRRNCSGRREEKPHSGFEGANSYQFRLWEMNKKDFLGAYQKSVLERIFHK